MKGQALQQNLESHFIPPASKRSGCHYCLCFACRSEMIQHMVCAHAIKLCRNHTKADAASRGSSRVNEDGPGPTFFSPGVLFRNEGFTLTTL